jgi:hypothetical protein
MMFDVKQSGKHFRGPFDRVGSPTPGTEPVFAAPIDISSIATGRAGKNSGAKFDRSAGTCFINGFQMFGFDIKRSIPGSEVLIKMLLINLSKVESFGWYFRRGTL